MPKTDSPKSPKPSRPPSRPAQTATIASQPTRTPGVLRNSVVFVALAVGGVVIKYLNGIITPLVVAVFMLMLIDGFSRTVALRFPRWPEWLRLGGAAILAVGALTLISGVFIHYGKAFGGQTAVIEPKINLMLERVSGLLQMQPIGLPDLFQGEGPSASLTKLFGAARGVATAFGLVVIYLGFLLASRQPFKRKMNRLFGSHQGDAERVFDRVRVASEQYMGLQTFKAALVATAAWVIIFAVGLPNAPFWALLIFLSAYIPILGGIAAVVGPTLIALAQFDDPTRPLILFLCLGAAAFMIENVLLPKLQGDRLNVDPVVVLLSLGFWGVILGLPGVFLSTPLTVVVMAIAGEFESTQWLAVLLSREGDPAPADPD